MFDCNAGWPLADPAAIQTTVHGTKLLMKQIQLAIPTQPTLW